MDELEVYREGVEITPWNMAEINAENARYYGMNPQMNQATEEMAELIQALNKYRRKPGDETRAHVIEEVADVEIMLEQMKELFSIDSVDITDVKVQKIRRTRERIKADMLRQEQEAEKRRMQ